MPKLEGRRSVIYGTAAREGCGDLTHLIVLGDGSSVNLTKAAVMRPRTETALPGVVKKASGLCPPDSRAGLFPHFLLHSHANAVVHQGNVPY